MARGSIISLHLLRIVSFLFFSPSHLEIVGCSFLLWLLSFLFHQTYIYFFWVHLIRFQLPTVNLVGRWTGSGADEESATMDAGWWKNATGKKEYRCQWEISSNLKLIADQNVETRDDRQPFVSISSHNAFHSRWLLYKYPTQQLSNDIQHYRWWPFNCAFLSHVKSSEAINNWLIGWIRLNWSVEFDCRCRRRKGSPVTFQLCFHLSALSPELLIRTSATAWKKINHRRLFSAYLRSIISDKWRRPSRKLTSFFVKTNFFIRFFRILPHSSGYLEI